MHYFTFSPSRYLLLNPLNPCPLHCLVWGIWSFHYHLLVMVAYRHPYSVLMFGRHHIMVVRDFVCLHFSFWLHQHVFVARISFSCRHGVFRGIFFIRCWILDFHCLLQKEHCPPLSCLRCISSTLFRLGVLLVILLSLWLLSHFSIAKLRQADYRKYRWLYLLHKKIGNLPHFLVLTIVEPAHARHDLSRLNSALAYSQPSVLTFHLSVFTFKSGYSFLFPWNYLLVLFPCSLLDSTVKIKTVSINNIRI